MLDWQVFLSAENFQRAWKKVRAIRDVLAWMPIPPLLYVVMGFNV